VGSLRHRGEGSAAHRLGEIDGAVVTRAYETFVVNAKRASYFLDIHEEANSGPGAPTTPYRELPRGAVVFIVGALDAYLAELSAEVIVRDLDRAIADADVRDLLRRIQADVPTLALEVTLLSSQAERIERLRDIIVDHFHNRVSMHGAKAVGTAAARLGRRGDDVWSALASRGWSRPAEALDRWTDIRHQIVHQGKKPTVRRPQARECITLIKETVGLIDGFAGGQQ